MEAKLITLTTDFGHRDPFVGIIKGVILGINPEARVVDLTHGIPPQDVLAAALALRYAAPSFPQGTIHVAVVDPGVGSDRKPLLIETEAGFFIGPDNGVLSLALEGARSKLAIELSNVAYRLKPTSATFHGRDIFAPAAAYLSLGIAPKDLGREVTGFTRLDWPRAAKTNGELLGKVIYIDGFGNLITNVQAEDLRLFPPERLTISVADVTIQGLAPHYSVVPERGWAALINSWGLLEISSFRASAERQCGAKVGDPIVVRNNRE